MKHPFLAIPGHLETAVTQIRLGHGVRPVSASPKQQSIAPYLRMTYSCQSDKSRDPETWRGPNGSSSSYLYMTRAISR